MDDCKLKMLYEPLDEGGYMAHAPGVRGLIVYGPTFDEMADCVGSVARMFLDVILDYDDPVPQPLRPFAVRSAEDIPVDLVAAEPSQYIGIDDDDADALFSALASRPNPVAVHRN